MTLFEKLKTSPAPNDEPLYLVTHVRATATEVIEIEGRGLLAVLEDDGRVSFVVLSEDVGESYIVGTEEPKTPAYYRIVFHGYGYSGALRELRHTYWGESGYIFYPNGKMIADAFAKLGRWFDCD